MTYDELKKNGGYITLDRDGRVMRFTNYPVPTGPVDGYHRLSVELVFTTGAEDNADGNMADAVRAGIKYAERGYHVDCLRGELLEDANYEDEIEYAAFAFIWKWVDVSMSESALREIQDQLRADADEIGGDYGSTACPGLDVDHLPAWWRLPMQISFSDYGKQSAAVIELNRKLNALA